jgi:hypothetical protein
VEPTDVLSRLLPNRHLRERVEFAGELLAAAQSLRVEHENGTNLVYRLGKYPTITEYGYTDEPGRWDHWPSGFLFTGAHEDGVDGTMILAPGTIIYPFKSYVRTPIRLQIEQGKILDISGELDAALMRDYMEQFNDPDGYAISHIGWGLNEKARWSAPMMDTRGIGQEGRSFYGNVLFATGPNQELGGSNASPCHIVGAVRRRLRPVHPGQHAVLEGQRLRGDRHLLGLLARDDGGGVRGHLFPGAGRQLCQRYHRRLAGLAPVPAAAGARPGVEHRQRGHVAV